MSEQSTISTEMLDAAAKAVGKYLTSLCIDSVDESAIAEAALRAAGVPELAARIAELEAALRNRICEGCNALVANVGMLHLCGCDEQRNLCSACKAECACAGGE
jgi:hypothetical protein